MAGMPSPQLPPTPTRRLPGITAITALGVAAVLVSGGCGQDAGPSPSATGTTPGATGTTPGPTASPDDTASAIALARVGGVAGFLDVLSVAPDGHVTGTTRSGAVDCAVPAETAQVLATAAAPTTGLAQGTDRIAVSVEREGTTIDLGEGQGGDPLTTAALSVLDDVQLPEGQRTVCTTTP
jgi:hypothetical protein